MEKDDRELFAMMEGGKYRREDEELFAMMRGRKTRERKRETVMVDVLGHTCLMPEESYYRKIKRAQDVARAIPLTVAGIATVCGMIWPGLLWLYTGVIGAAAHIALELRGAAI